MAQARWAKASLCAPTCPPAPAPGSASQPWLWRGHELPTHALHTQLCLLPLVLACSSAAAA